MAEALTARRSSGNRIFDYCHFLFMLPLAAGLSVGLEELASAQGRVDPQSSTHKPQPARPLDPMNRPMSDAVLSYEF